MRTIEELRFAALLRARDFCEENKSILITIPEYPPLRVLLDAGIIKIESARAINMANITSYAAAKLQTQIYMVDLVYMYQLRGAVKAHELNKFELEDSLSHPKKYFTHNDDAGIGVKCEEIKNILKTNKDDLTNIKAEDITLMENAILAYNDILAAPKEAIDKRKAYGTDRIYNLINEADVPKINIGKIVHSYFAEIIPGWDQAIKVGKSSGVRHTSVAIQFNVAGTDLKLKNVKCTITNGSETYTCKSSALGWVRFYSLITDTWIATCELETFETYTLSGIEADDYHVEKRYIPLQKKSQPDGGGDPEVTTGILSLIVYDKETGQPLAGVINSIPALDHSNTTDEDGEDYRDGIPPDDYQGTLFCDGYIPLNYNFTSEAGKTCTLQLYMEKETV